MRIVILCCRVVGCHATHLLLLLGRFSSQQATDQTSAGPLRRTGRVVKVAVVGIVIVVLVSMSPDWTCHHQVALEAQAPRGIPFIVFVHDEIFTDARMKTTRQTDRAQAET